MLLFKTALIAVVSAAGEQVKCPVLSCINVGMNTTEECY